MRELAVRTTIEQCDARKFYDTVLKDANVTQRLHKQLSMDDNAEVSPWCLTEDSREGTRTVQFCLQVNIPQWLLSMVGADTIKVREEQTLVWENDQRLTIVSEPQVLGVPLSSSTTTRIVLAVTNNTNGQDCDLEFTVQVSAAMRWPMSSAMEAIMASDAKGNVANQLEFYRSLLRDIAMGVLVHEQPTYLYNTHEKAIASALERKRTVRQMLTSQTSMAQRLFYDAVEILDNEHPGEPLTEVLVEDSDGGLTEPLLGGRPGSAQGSVLHERGGGPAHGVFAWEEPITMIARGLVRTERSVKITKRTLGATQTVIMLMLGAVIVLQSLILWQLRHGKGHLGG